MIFYFLQSLIIILGLATLREPFPVYKLMAALAYGAVLRWQVATCPKAILYRIALLIPALCLWSPLLCCMLLGAMLPVAKSIPNFLQKYFVKLMLCSVVLLGIIYYRPPVSYSILISLCIANIFVGAHFVVKDYPLKRFKIFNSKFALIIPILIFLAIFNLPMGSKKSVPDNPLANSMLPMALQTEMPNVDALWVKNETQQETREFYGLPWINSSTYFAPEVTWRNYFSFEILFSNISRTPYDGKKYELIIVSNLPSKATNSALAKFVEHLIAHYLDPQGAIIYPAEIMVNHNLKECNLIGNPHYVAVGEDVSDDIATLQKRLKEHNATYSSLVDDKIFPILIDIMNENISPQKYPVNSPFPQVPALYLAIAGAIYLFMRLFFTRFSGFVACCANLETGVTMGALMGLIAYSLEFEYLFSGFPFQFLIFAFALLFYTQAKCHYWRWNLGFFLSIIATIGMLLYFTPLATLLIFPLWILNIFFARGIFDDIAARHPQFPQLSIVIIGLALGVFGAQHLSLNLLLATILISLVPRMIRS